MQCNMCMIVLQLQLENTLEINGILCLWDVKTSIKFYYVNISIMSDCIVFLNSFLKRSWKYILTKYLKSL